MSQLRLPTIYNPAKQLLAIAPEDKARTHTKHSRMLAWSELLGIPKERLPSLYYAIAQISQMPRDAKLALESILGERAVKYTGWVEPVEKELTSPNLDNPFKSIVDILNSERRNIIDICGDQIDGSLDAATLTSDGSAKVNLIYNDLWLLVDKVRDSDEIDLRNRVFLLKQLELIDKSIIDLKIKGGHSSAQTFESSVGFTAVNREVFEDISKSEYGRDLIKILATFTLFVGTLRGTEYLIEKAEAASKLLSEAISDETDDSVVDEDPTPE